MDHLIITNMLVLAAIAIIAASILYFISQKFKVIEDPRIDEVEELLPSANCGACGKAGCRDFAKACVGASEKDFQTLYCPVGGKIIMEKVASKLGYQAVEKEATVAVLRCNGTCENAPEKVQYEGIKICRIANKVCSGNSGCPTGCLHLGDCIKVCKFDALHMNETNGMPEVDEDKCTSCGACVNICPRGLFEIRPKGVNNERVYVACRNTQKGAIAKKNCKVACIGCMKCTKINPEVKVENNLSYIPSSVNAAEYGEELAKSCPTGAIVYTKSKES